MDTRLGTGTMSAHPESRQRTAQAYRRIRAITERLVEPLTEEDQGLQSMPECSPAKWHRAHTSWFFETFVLVPQGTAAFNSRWGHLFNSYYEAAGSRHPRPKRGMLSRPSAQEVSNYRQHVDDRMLELIEHCDPSVWAQIGPIVALGLAHEQQHQELLLTDILNALYENPLRPAYRPCAPVSLLEKAGAAPKLQFVQFDGGLFEIGAKESKHFCFDNERPRHRVWLEPFELSSRLVTVGEWKAFALEKGYETPSLWLSEGYDWVKANRIEAPLYAHWQGGALLVFGLDGERQAVDSEPITHLSYYEADAIARFMGARLPSEAEWEVVAASCPLEGNFLEEGALRALPSTVKDEGHVHQLYGDAWEWTQSSYSPYPGYQPPKGALGEYNGKFMVNQMVLRGGSCFTPLGHIRATYRNFWHPHTRFQVTGVRLARSV